LSGSTKSKEKKKRRGSVLFLSLPGLSGDTDEDGGRGSGGTKKHVWYEIEIISVTNILSGDHCPVSISWKRGNKKKNQGQTPFMNPSSGVTTFNDYVKLTSTLIQQHAHHQLSDPMLPSSPSAAAYQAKHIHFYLEQVNNANFFALLCTNASFRK